MESSPTITSPTTGLLPGITAWLAGERSVRAAVLFGSSARLPADAVATANRSDLDLQVMTTAPAELERVDWGRVLPGQEFCHQAVRPATGGVRKVTVIFTRGEIDLVPVPLGRFRAARLAMWLGFHRKPGPLRAALNEVSTLLASGYRMLKGEKEWGPFYARIAAEMPGVRLSDGEAKVLADVFLCDLAWVLQKLERGELSAAQYLLHRSLAEVNFRLVRELRLRRGLPLPSFGIARRVEALLTPAELAWVQVDAPLRRDELGQAAWRSFDGLKMLMRDVVPTWSVPEKMSAVLATRAR